MSWRGVTTLIAAGGAFFFYGGGDLGDGIGNYVQGVLEVC